MTVSQTLSKKYFGQHWTHLLLGQLWSSGNIDKKIEVRGFIKDAAEYIFPAGKSAPFCYWYAGGAQFGSPEKGVDINRIRLYKMTMSRTLPTLIQNPGNTPELIASALRSAILKGRLKSNQPLRQDQIAEQFGVSKIPVREAMVQLRAEGLTVFIPNRGFVVSELSPAEAEEIYMMRMALETKALERAIPKLRPADLIRAASVLDISETEDDRSEWSELNWEFHSSLYQAAQLPRLLSTIQVLHNNVARYLLIYLGGLSARDASHAEHKKILQACQKKEIDRAVKILQQHLSRASDRLVAFLSDNRDNVTGR